MNVQGKVWVARNGERYEARLRFRPGQTGELTFRQLPEGLSWSVAVGPHVSLLEMKTFELEAWLQVARGKELRG